jgi:predicted transcriptional regulator
MKQSPNPTDAELEILQTLWQYGSCSVKQVHGFLQEKREVGYTTILKQLQIMLEKQLVERDASTRIHLYRATNSEQHTKEKLIQKFVINTFQGSSHHLVMQLLGNAAASADELAEIKKLISQLEDKDCSSEIIEPI